MSWFINVNKTQGISILLESSIGVTLDFCHTSSEISDWLAGWQAGWLAGRLFSRIECLKKRIGKSGRFCTSGSNLVLNVIQCRFGALAESLTVAGWPAVTGCLAGRGWRSGRGWLGGWLANGILQKYWNSIGFIDLLKSWHHLKFKNDWNSRGFSTKMLRDTDGILQKYWNS